MVFEPPRGGAPAPQGARAGRAGAGAGERGVHLLLQADQPQAGGRGAAAPRARRGRVQAVPRLLLRRGLDQGRGRVRRVLPVVRQWRGPPLLRHLHPRLLQEVHQEEPRAGEGVRDRGERAVALPGVRPPPGVETARRLLQRLDVPEDHRGPGGRGPGQGQEEDEEVFH